MCARRADMCVRVADFRGRQTVLRLRRTGIHVYPRRRVRYAGMFVGHGIMWGLDADICGRCVDFARDMQRSTALLWMGLLALCFAFVLHTFF